MRHPRLQENSGCWSWTLADRRPSDETPREVQRIWVHQVAPRIGWAAGPTKTHPGPDLLKNIHTQRRAKQLIQPIRQVKLNLATSAVRCLPKNHIYPPKKHRVIPKKLNIKTHLCPQSFRRNLQKQKREIPDVPQRDDSWKPCPASTWKRHRSRCWSCQSAGGDTPGPDQRFAGNRRRPLAVGHVLRHPGVFNGFSYRDNVGITMDNKGIS